MAQQCPPHRAIAAPPRGSGTAAAAGHSLASCQDTFSTIGPADRPGHRSDRRWWRRGAARAVPGRSRFSTIQSALGLQPAVLAQRLTDSRRGMLVKSVRVAPPRYDYRFTDSRAFWTPAACGGGARTAVGGRPPRRARDRDAATKRPVVVTRNRRALDVAACESPATAGDYFAAASRRPVLPLHVGPLFPERTMATEIHPKYPETHVSCSCGTRSPPGRRGVSSLHTRSATMPPVFVTEAEARRSGGRFGVHSVRHSKSSTK